MAEMLLLAAGVSASTAATIGSVVSGLGTLLTVGTGIAGAISSSNQMNNQAQLARLQAESGMITAEMEMVKGQLEANRIRESLMKTLASQRARYASAGIVLDSGTPSTVAEQSTEEADRETQVAQTSADMKAASARIAAANQETKASLLEDSADWALVGGIGGALAKGLTSTSRMVDLMEGSPTGGRNYVDQGSWT